MKLLILLLSALIILSLPAALKDYQGSWQNISNFQQYEDEDWGYIESHDQLTIEIYSPNSCSAYHETYENGQAVSGSQLQCVLNNKTIRIQSGISGTVIIQGELSLDAEKLVVTEYLPIHSDEKVADKKIETFFSRFIVGI